MKNIIKKDRKDYKSHWHCVFKLKYHLVLVTKYRKECLTDEMIKKIEFHCQH